MFIREEMKKIFRFRLFWLMIVVFFAFNTFLVYTNYDSIAQAVSIVNAYVHFGVVSRDDEYGFCDDFEEAKENAVHDYYDDLSAQKLLEIAASFSGNRESGIVNKIVKKNYKKVDARIQQIKSDGEAEELYYVGTTLELHQELYGTILSFVLLECVLLAVLMTAYLMNYEEIFQTHQNVYSSKRGRALVFSKAMAAVLITLFASGMIIVYTLVIYFCRVPQMWSFLQSSVSSAMATENRIITYPFITWVKMSQWQYLLATAALMIVYAVLASFITFALSFISRNAFVNIALTAILYFIFFAVWFGFPNLTVLSFIQVFNPSIAMYNLKGWFMEFALNPQLSYPGYEIAVAVTYLVVTVAAVILLWKWFRRKDIG